MTKKEVLKRIKSFCFECIGGKLREVEGCTGSRCPLFEIKGGVDKKPNKTRSALSKALKMDAANGAPEHQFSQQDQRSGLGGGMDMPVEQISNSGTNNCAQEIK